MRPREGEPILIFVLSKSSSSYIFTTDLDKILSRTLVHRQLDTYRKICILVEVILSFEEEFYEKRSYRFVKWGVPNEFALKFSKSVRV